MDVDVLQQVLNINCLMDRIVYFAVMLSFVAEGYFVLCFGKDLRGLMFEMRVS